MDKLSEQIEQCKKELSIPRQKVSESCHEIIQYATTEADPLRDGIPNQDNNFKSGGSCCTIL